MMKIDILEVMEVAQQEINEMLIGNQYMDDLQWGETCFKIPVWDGEPMHEKVIAEFIFIYDEDDVFERSVWEQLNDELIRFEQDLQEVA